MTLPRLSIPPRLFRGIQIAFAVALLFALWHTADGPEAARILADAHLPWLLAAMAALTLQTVLSALRWKLTAEQFGIFLRPGYAVREYYLSQVVNQSLPGGMIGDAGRAFRHRAQAGLAASGLAVVYERLAGQLAMVALMAGAFVITLVRPGGLDWPEWLAWPMVMVLLGAAVLPFCLPLMVRVGGAAGRGAGRVLATTSRAFLGRQVFPRQVALSFGTALCNLAAFTACAAAMDLPLPVAAVFALVPLILLTMLIPISVSGWGLREGAAAALLPIVGATASQGLAASVAFGLVFFITTLPGVLPLWQRPRTPNREA